MRSVKIEAITAGPDGRLLVKPALPPDEDYRFIWRDASSVRWDPGLRCLFTLHIEGFSQPEYFQKIVAAVRNEYGDELAVSSDTAFSGLPEAVQEQIRRNERRAEQGNGA